MDALWKLCSVSRDEWMSEWMDEWMSEWIDEWMSEWIDEWMPEWIDEWGKVFKMTSLTDHERFEVGGIKLLYVDCLQSVKTISTA